MKKTKGFTLIELLVVIAIIGLLATIVLVSLNSARSKARDTRRVSDLRQVALAMEMYYDDIKHYPALVAAGCSAATWTAMSALLSPNYMSAVPTDPSITGNYMYGVGTDFAAPQKYVLRTVTEGFVTGLSTDVDGAAVLGCDCGTAANGEGTAERKYCIQP